MASGYGKQSFGQKVKGTLRRIFMLSVIGGTFIGAPAYYEYGTVKTEEVKVKEVKAVWDHYDSKKGESVYNYKIVTDKGTVLANKNSTLHFKFNSKDIQDQLSDGRDAYNYTPSYNWFGNDEGGSQQEQKKKDPALDPSNKVWRIKYYGARIDVPFIHTFPNVLSVEEVSRDELAARAKAQQQAQRDQQQQIKKDQQGAVQPGQQQNGTVTTPAQPGQLSGTMITFTTVVNGQSVELSVPIEAAGKVTVNKVTPLVPTPPKGPGT
ncbi:MAG: hypothetical protein EPN97_10890 [Alphaproteobacteria bacterium]|nr:MAG: hypothetical protein EPN97_10890 [Alphaproteobacteria bacterium]